jgi:hypothetical protein
MCGLLITPAVLRSPFGRNLVLRELLRFAWMIVLPFVAVVRGVCALDALGFGRNITQDNYVMGFPAGAWLDGAVSALSVCGIVLAVLWLAGKTSPPGGWRGIGPRGFRDSLYNEVHWAFYRVAPTVWLNDALAGVSIGFALMALEWLAHPGFAAMQKSTKGRQRLVIMFACAIASGFLYLATRNIWLMILTNLAIQLVGSRLLAGQGPTTPVLDKA